MQDLFEVDYRGTDLAGVDEVGRGPLAGDVVAAAVIEALDSLHLAYPKVGKVQREELAAAKTELLAEK